MLRFMCACLALSLAVPASAADEDWWLAESNRFRVYSAGGEDTARDLAIRLEKLDMAMRIYTGISPDKHGSTPEVAKPTLYQFGDNKDIGGLIGVDSVYGFFIPRAGDSVAFMPLTTENNKRRNGSPGTRNYTEFNDYPLEALSVIQHEYTHYFMYQHAPLAYPIWYSEGLAEVFGMLRIEDNRFFLGDPPPHRMNEIAYFDVDAEEMFKPVKNYVNYPHYGHGWLLSSYLAFEPARKGQLAKYLKLINAGTDSLEAARQAFGDLDQLSDELNAYRKQRARGMSVPFPPDSDPQVTMHRLTRDEAARMELLIRSQAGVTKQQASRQVGDAMKLVEQYPKSVPVMLEAAEVQTDAGNLASGYEIYKKVASIEPDSIDANLGLARLEMQFAETDHAWLHLARQSFIRVNQIEHDEPNALAGYYRTFVLADVAPPEDAIIALEGAYSRAPFDNDIRKMLAYQLITEDRAAEAMTILGPILNSAHESKDVKKLRELAVQFSDGNRDPLIKELKPSFSEDE